MSKLVGMIICLALAPACLAQPKTSEPSGGIPSRHVWENDSGVQIRWHAQESILTESRLETEHLSDADYAMLNRLLADLKSIEARAGGPSFGSQKPDESQSCDIALQTSELIGPPVSRIEDFLGLGGPVLFGTIAETTPGFVNGQIGSGLRLEVEQNLSPLREGTVPDEVLLLHPAGRVVLDDLRICATADDGRAAPRPGDRVLLGVRTSQWYGDAIVVDSSLFLVEGSDGELSLPRSLRPSLSETSMLEVVNFLKELNLRRSGGQGDRR